MDHSPPNLPPEPTPEEPPSPPPDRFPTIVLAGPGCLCLLFVLGASGVGGGELLLPALAAVGASIFFGIIASRARDANARSLWTLAAFLGPVLFCLTLMSRM
ncbi:MAG: hypothetical protein Tsb0013_01250 [Phycisphaerales bacterium]